MSFAFERIHAAVAAHLTERLYYASKSGFIFSTTDSCSRVQLPFYGIIAISNDGKPIRAIAGEHRIEQPAFAVWAKDIRFDCPAQGYMTVGVNPLHRLFRAFTKLDTPHVLPLRYSQFSHLRPSMASAQAGTLTHESALRLFNDVLDVARPRSRS